MVAGATIYLIVLVAFIVWRFVVDTLQARQLVGVSGAHAQRGNKLFGGVTLFAGCLRDGSGRVGPFDTQNGATNYLQRVVALTRSKPTDDTFVLDVGTTRFWVRDRHVRRLRDLNDPTCEYEETCFYLPHKSMPSSEQIATVLLGLANNPALFDCWANRVGVVKADGQVFDDR